jgi:predicted nucleic acid-binding protein
MATGLSLDTGALIAAEKGVRSFWAFWKEALDRGAPITVSAAVIAQAWRGNSAVTARLLGACDVEILDEPAAMAVGRLLAASRTSDIVDAAVVIGAVARGDAILTSDPDDIGRLVEAAGKPVPILPI